MKKVLVLLIGYLIWGPVILVLVPVPLIGALVLTPFNIGGKATKLLVTAAKLPLRVVAKLV